MEEVVIETIKNQDGELIPSESIFLRDDGVICHKSLNCYSSADLGLGTCGCHSHDPFRVVPIPPGELGFYEKLEKLMGEIPWAEWRSPRRVFLQTLGVAGVSLQRLEEFCELSYRLSSNPLPKIRELFPSFRVCFMSQDPDRRSGFDWKEGDTPLIAVELCDQRDSEGGLKVWIETYGF